MQIINLKDKNIIITGAASGIGKETAITASRLGANVIMLDLSEDGLKETTYLLYGNNHSYYITDLTDTESISTIIKEIIEKNGIINGLVHCAGISSRKPLNVLTKDGFSKVMDVNFYSFVELVRQVCKKKHFAEGGSVVVMSSISSIRGYKAKSEYCVSKAAVDSFVRCMALELADRKIRINSVMAAEVLTPLALKAKEMNQAVGASDFNAPLGPSDPYEVANTILFLLSDATRTITGTSILIDGGACI
ncbi:MAG: SDR family oxidoreductase [Bacteroidales bacterium]|nr:SDR family oxidoreductase [Bacteroidales bacterium]